MVTRWFEKLTRRQPVGGDLMVEARVAADAGDYTAALAVWEPLARAGHARAQNNIGACFSEGLGVERNPSLAIKWLTLSAEGGDAVGQRNLATAFLKGLGVKVDGSRAAELFRAAAEQGDGPAQDKLSSMLLAGDLITPDVEEARHW